MPKRIIDENELSDVSGGVVGKEYICPWCKNKIPRICYDTHVYKTCIKLPLEAMSRRKKPTLFEQASDFTFLDTLDKENSL